ncbi:8780_t:CDS:2 [Cetraspora pellucida]|uniref:8780_t:CDS:1 n=1 Tax=Cetraspora pellucida TaxID=1433469 RepID=A0ACA9MKH2_9GLOM|nr:8780_t:CDS:2 [Cetraspora pellucida]
MKKLSLNDAYIIAKSHDGVCLSTEYKNDKSHVKLTLKDAKQIAISKYGQCLSTECAESHEWTVSLVQIINSGSWCSHCAGNARCTIEDAKQVTQSHEWLASFSKIKNTYNKNGKCLSEKYINSDTPLQWRCIKGHEWIAQFHSIKNRHSWCPYCSKYKRESLCREIIIKYLGPPSENRKPDFLKTPEYPTGLQLDIPYYNYGFAIEVQGQQHEKYIEFFHRGNPNNFKNGINSRKNYVKKTGSF